MRLWTAFERKGAMDVYGWRGKGGQVNIPPIWTPLAILFFILHIFLLEVSDIFVFLFIHFLFFLSFEIRISTRRREGKKEASGNRGGGSHAKPEWPNWSLIAASHQWRNWRVEWSSQRTSVSVYDWSIILSLTGFLSNNTSSGGLEVLARKWQNSNDFIWNETKT